MSAPSPVPLSDLNALDREEFTARLESIFEHSPWVASAAWDAGPFESVETLHRAMVGAVTVAPRARQLELIRAHPDLAGRAAGAGRLTAASGSEQARVGLDRLPADLDAQLTRASDEYRERFGFPFVVCVLGHTPESILAQVERRLGHSEEDEICAALDEIGNIAALRLQGAVTPPSRRD